MEPGGWLADTAILHWQHWLLALAVNGGPILLLHRLPLLTSSGWWHAGALGTILWATLGWRGWLAVVVYFAIGSAVTRLGLRRKQASGIAEARGGRRGPANVWGSAAIGLGLAVLGTGLPPGATPLLLVGFVASFAAKLGDTCGSEIGKSWGGRTVLITTLRPVAPGTEGAVSAVGSLASLAGAAVYSWIGLALLAPLIGSHPVHYPGLAAVAVVGLSGFVATVIESWIGACWQTRLGWLSNEQVNGLMTAVAALLAMACWWALGARFAGPG